ncbi:MAG TPA: DUF4231 domain-containing protein [Ktedonobacterales bacterium]
MGEVFELKRTDLPAIYRAASDESGRGQRVFQVSTVIGLFLLVVAAIAGLGTVKIHSIDWAGVIAAAAFFTAIIVRTYRLITQPDKVWYNGRAVAESGKTLGWRYAVGGEPFGINALTPPQADKRLAERLTEMLTDIRHLPLDPASEGAEQISPAMRALRARPLEDRKATYAEGRIAAQQAWYARKAKENKRLARLWNAILLAIEIVGGVAAILKAIGVLPLDLLGLFGTVAAAGTSWLQAKQYTALAQTYSITSYELAAIRARIADQTTEDDWARFVDEAEEAISREHMLWRASHADIPTPKVEF